MTTMHIRIRELAAPNRREQLIVETTAEVSVTEQSRNAPAESLTRGMWKERCEAGWQDRLVSLQQCICELLITNQQLRMALKAEREQG